MINKTKIRSIEFVLAWVLLIFINQSVFADDVYRPYLHNPIIPENPGLNIQGIFQTDLWYGAGIYVYPIDIPPGRSGLQPIISLNYNSHLTNQRSSIVGTAWTLNENYIFRDVDYSFSDTSDDKFKLILNGQAYDLVYDSSDGKYHTQVESYLYIKNMSGGNNTNNIYWIVKTTDGTTYRLGYNNNSELTSNLYGYTTKWSLDLITDTDDNNIYYSYKEDPYSNDSGAVYPYRIEYNNDKKRVIEFVLESSDRPDKLLVYEQGNKIRESRRIREIQIKADGDLVRKYILNYTILGSDSKSSLISITQYGNNNVTSLPSVTFDYYSPIAGWYVDNNFILPSSEGLFFESNKSDFGVRLLDLNRDGLIDIIKADGSNSSQNQSWINNGSEWVRNDLWNIPDYVIDSNKMDTGIRFIDFNGDGFTDIVKGDGDLRESWQNSMNGWVENSTWHLPSGAAPVSVPGSLDEGVRFEDVNGDGLVDILRAAEFWVEDNKIWINNGSGWVFDSSWKLPSDALFLDFDGNDRGVRIEDVNEDGLVDLIKGKESDERATWLNNGTGWVNNSIWAIPSEVYFSNINGEDQGVRITDINGDGLVDLIQRKEDNIRRTWINNGNGWIRNDSWSVPSSAYFVSSDGTNKAVRIVDVDGDGLADLMNGESSNRITFVNKRTPKAYFLKKVINNLGGSVVIDYIASTSLDNTGIDNISDIGFNMWVIGTLLDSSGLKDLQNISFVTYYSYLNGYYDYEDKEFRGFNKVDDIKPNISIVSHWFYQNDSLKGKEYQTEIYDSYSKIFKKILYDWNGTKKNNYYSNLLNKKTDYLYDGVYNNPKITENRYTYDNYGNILFINNSGDNSISKDEKYEYFDYVYNTSNWIVNKVKHYVLYDFDNLTKVSEIFYRYDNLNYGQAPTKGSLTNKEDWLDEGENPITKYGYDSYGNLINETDARGYVTKYVYGIRDSTHTFIDQIINAKGHIIDYNYDLGTGNLLWETDANNNYKNYTYDIFGRIEKEISPYDSVAYPTKEYNYSLDGAAPESIKISLRENNGSSETLDFYYFYDGFGNLIQTKKEAENSNHVINDIYYDPINRVIKQSNPYFVAADENYSIANYSVSAIIYTYDPLSRIVKVINLDGTVKNVTFEHWKIIQYDENNHKQIYYLDAYGQVVKVIEYIGNNYFETKYDYDSLGNLLSIIDSQNNIFNYTYDSLGRKIKEKNIDSGIWQYYYDNAGNLIKQVDNNSINITLNYDELNRMVSKNKSNETINYIYDNINGTLRKIITSDLNINYTYDNRLRKIKETKIIGDKIFIKQWIYDSLNRIKTETLPDSSIITYNYTVQGKIKRITNILDDIQYNPFSDPTKLSYINNLDTDYTYNESTYRIEKIKTGVNKQELNYEYDKVGNVISINDSSNNFIISMIYDTLNRLIFSKKDSSDNLYEFEFNYTYDSLGNILEIINGDRNISYFHNLKPKHAPHLITMTEIVVLPNDTYKFYIKDNSENNVAWLGDSGNIVLKGICNATSVCTAPANSFIIANSSDNTVAYIDNQGNLCIEKGDCSDESASCNPSRDAFIIRNSTNSNMSYIDFNGELCLTGKLYENIAL